MLELALLRSGATQHVFVRTDPVRTAWVYKTPAVLDELLPGRVRLHTLRPTRRLSRCLYAVVFGAPRAVWHWSIPPDPTVSTGADVPWLTKAALSCRSLYLGSVNGVLARYLRRARVRRFNRALGLHARIARSPAAQVLMPFRVITRARASLHCATGTLPYLGPVLRQKRADVFFDRAENLARLDWDELIAAEHRLWRHGIGIEDGAAAIGPFGWALSNDQLYLADTASLTTDLRQVRHALDENVIETRWTQRFARLTGDSRREAEEYFHHVRLQIDVQTLRRLWMTAT